MHTHQAVETILADFFNQARCVVFDVPGQMVITWGALLMDVILIKPQFRIGSGGSIVPGVILACVVTAAADTRKVFISFPDVCVECGLCLLCEI